MVTVQPGPHTLQPLGGHHQVGGLPGGGLPPEVEAAGLVEVPQEVTLGHAQCPRPEDLHNNVSGETIDMSFSYFVTLIGLATRHEGK